MPSLYCNRLPLNWLESDPELRSLPEREPLEVFLKRQILVTRRSLQVELPQYLGDKQPNHRHGNGSPRTPPRALAEGLRRRQVVIFVFGVKLRVIWRQPAFRMELEWVAKEPRAPCCSEITNLTDDLVHSKVSIGTFKAHTETRDASGSK